MGKSNYICGRCGRISGLPDFCCERAMVQKGSYVCKTCGATAGCPGECCGQPMQQL